ncbi:ABC transporter substrate-binding protein, partial [Pseudomonas aeruginosa]
PKKGLPVKLIAVASQPKTQTVFSEQIPSGPGRKGPLALPPKTLREALPTAPANSEGARGVAAECWVDHVEELEQRFNVWAAR